MAWHFSKHFPHIYRKKKYARMYEQAHFLLSVHMLTSSPVLFAPVLSYLRSRVADPDPKDPYVFGPPRSASGSINQRYGSGSGSFYHQAKIVRKALMPTVLWLLYDFLSLKNDVRVNITSKGNKQKNFVDILKITDKNSRIRIRIH
jgi:hypothetical protein